MTELSAERNYAVANKQQAAEAAAALEAEAAALLDQKKQAVTALQSQISQLKVCSRHYNISLDSPPENFQPCCVSAVFPDTMLISHDHAEVHILVSAVSIL